ncbi:hypothetical protein [Microterricola viridarii]|uniref:DUF559 domain-containing protein n=1 Tax=Microterricola viridarii TaxID=412690 RepID=A0A1H1UGY8_9MICO|nr:hypothetical protein [Microterricola viridarii]SDS71733.1 hypothetical protein SAMN04489834_2006 [Microterricola viridarii]
MVAVRFRCGHGASPDAAAGTERVLTLQRGCPLCMLIAETQRSRAELLRKVAPPERALLANETRVGAEYSWVCPRGHDRYRATVLAVLSGPSCAKCIRNASGTSAARDAGVPSMNAGLRTRTSMTEQRLRMLLAERIRLPQGVNTIRLARMFYGRQEAWPDIVIPALRIAVEYDDPGRSRRAHRGLKQASDREKDDALAEVGWEVIRIRAGGLESLGANSIVCASLTIAAVDRAVERMREIRGDAAVDAVLA